MTAPRFSRAAILGVGLIGGSVALELRAAALAEHIVGYDPDAPNLAQAIDLGVLDDAADTIADAVRDADLVVIATPPAKIVASALAAAEHAKEGAIFTDVGSVKLAVVEPLQRSLPKHVRFVGGHPVAGTEKSGAVAAMRDLFRGRRFILTPLPETDPEALAAVRAMWSRIGAQVVLMSPAVHDAVCAQISHLPHVAAYALTAAIGDAGQGLPEIFGLGAGGFVDTTRIAASSPEMWRDIFLLNRDAVLDGIERMQAKIASLHELIERGDAEGLDRFLAGMREVRARVLKGG
jgi:prephenate dehydrogenase